jgi:alpha-1,2-mannosyltransferase
MIDLSVYRVAARAVITGVDPYSVGGPEGLPFTYPMFAALLFVPFTLVPEVLARAAITLVSFAALVLICQITVRQVLPGRTARQALLISLPAAVVALTAHPVLDTLFFGQVNLVLVALVLTDMFVLRGRSRGALVGLATGIKLTPGLFLVYYLVTGQRRAARNAAVMTALTVVAGFAVRPVATWEFFTRYMLDPARAGNVTYTGNQSILATTARLLRNAHPPAALTWGLSAAVVVFALLLARRLHRRGEELTAVSVVATAALLASPISWTHHWVWFIPATAVVARSVYLAGGGWRWVPLGLAELVLWTGPMRLMPKNDLRELADDRFQQLITNSFVLVAVAFLFWAAWPSANRLANRLGKDVFVARRRQGNRTLVVGGEHVDHEPQRTGRLVADRVGIGEGLRDVELHP